MKPYILGLALATFATAASATGQGEDLAIKVNELEFQSVDGAEHLNASDAFTIEPLALDQAVVDARASVQTNAMEFQSGNGAEALADAYPDAPQMITLD